jgi:hypothetical protein
MLFYGTNGCSTFLISKGPKFVYVRNVAYICHVLTTDYPVYPLVSHNKTYNFSKKVIVVSKKIVFPDKSFHDWQYTCRGS